MDLVDGAMSKFAREKLAEHEAYTVPGPGLGPVNRATLTRDPRHLGFMLARYKFVAKMLEGKSHVCEVGCHEALGTLIVAKEVQHVHAVDVMQDVIEFCQNEYAPHAPNISFQAADVISSLPPSPTSPDGTYEAIYLLDVLEHVDPDQEGVFLRNLCKRLGAHGVMIVGLPSLESQAYASPVSASQHINCKTREGLRETMGYLFENVFLFSMNDEVLHTGFGPMSQYLFAVGVSVRPGIVDHEGS